MMNNDKQQTINCDNEINQKNNYEFFGDDPKFKTKLITFILLSGGFFGFLNETLLNVALISIMTDMNIIKTQAQWLITGFMLVMATLAPISASLVQWFSTRRILLMILGVFFAGSLVCGLAVNFEMLLFGRLLQAIAAAFIAPVMTNTLLLIYNPSRRGSVFGLIGMVFMLAPMMGPTLSGLITTYFGWQSLFFFTMPFTALSFFLVWRYLTVNMQTVTRPKIDFISVILSILGLGSLVYVIAHFANFKIINSVFMLGLSLILLALFVFRQFTLKTPLLNLRVFFHKQFTIGVLIFSLTMAAFIGSELIMPMYAQQVVLLSGLTAGMILLPAAIINAILSPITGRVLDRFGPKVTVIPGAMIMTVAFLVMYFSFDIQTSAVYQAAVFLFVAVAVAMVVMPAETNGLNALDKPMYPHGSAVISTIQPLAGAIGTAFFINLATFKEQQVLQSIAQSGELQARLAMMEGVHLTYLVAAIMGVLVIVLAMQIQKSAKTSEANQENHP